MNRREAEVDAQDARRIIASQLLCELALRLLLASGMHQAVDWHLGCPGRARHPAGLATSHWQP